MPQASENYKWVAVGKKEFVVFESDSHDDGYAALGNALDAHGPVAHGTVTISHHWTCVFVIEQSNIDLDTLYKMLKSWASSPQIGRNQLDHPLELALITNKDGIPLPVGLSKTASDPGSGWQTVPKLWNKTDDDIRTDIQIQEKDRGTFPGQGTMRSEEGSLTEEPYQCITCGESFSDYKHMLNHVSFDHPKEKPTGHEEEIRDNDEFFYPDNEMSRPGGDVGVHTGAKKDIDIPGPIPFIYDIEEDRIRTGQPGDERVDIGEYNPFGMVEGFYTPEQDLIISTQTSVPYTISHVRRLWEYMHPEYEINHIYVVHKQDDKKVRERVSGA